MQPDEPKPVEVLGRHVPANEPRLLPVTVEADGFANDGAYSDWSGYSVPDTDIPPDEDGPWNDTPF